MGDTGLNMDFRKPVVIETFEMAWIASPQPGVERRRLEREHAESGRATTIVRYAPGASFPGHVHGGGEEYFVLEGVFSDENGDFGRGTYVRNPPGSRHRPFTEKGCTIFVKLCQMPSEGEPQVTVDTRAKGWLPGERVGHRVMPLFDSANEHVTLERLESGVHLRENPSHGGEEVLVIEGDLGLGGQSYGPETWIRSPANMKTQFSSQQGCTLWIKRGHLRCEEPK